MPTGDSEDVFKVTDRRRRLDAEDPPRPPLSSDESRPPVPHGSAPPGERSLAGLFMMLASSAVIALDAIDLLVLLREKTEGHRSGDESRILDELIYDLQVRYVQVTRQS